MTKRKLQISEETTVPRNVKKDLLFQVIKKKNKGKFLTKNQKI